MKKVISVLGVLLLATFLLPVKAFATSSNVYVNLSSLEYSVDKQNYTSVPEYVSLADFLVDYSANNLSSIYITDFLFDGVSSAKTPDLDDFIESDSNDTKIKTLDIKVININTTGDIEFTGEITGAMIGVNTNNVKGDINIILNGVNLNTDSKKAPAVYVYNKDKNYTDCVVTIKTASGTKNYLEGGKLKKVSLIGSDELDNYSSYYSGDSLVNYTSYPAYYGIYTSDEIENILFATVQADNEDLQDGDPYYFYKASGAISSDIDLNFEGEGFLKVTSKNKEGIETKGNLTFSGGTGNYEIYAEDDCLNTTTVNGSDSTVRNNLTIDVGSLLASVSVDADEGDAIDSNGKLIINGGNIYAYAHPNSADAGLDSVGGTYINGGTVIATGNMIDQISSESEQNFIYASFDQIADNTIVTVKDQDDKTIVEFGTDRAIKTLLYSSPELEYETFAIYANGEEITFSDMSGKGLMNQNSTGNVAIIALVAETILLSVALIFYIKKY